MLINESIYTIRNVRDHPILMDNNADFLSRMPLNTVENEDREEGFINYISKQTLVPIDHVKIQ